MKDIRIIESDTLTRLWEYFEGKADVDDGQPNEEMKLLSLIEDVINNTEESLTPTN